ncbi:MAG: GspE/PulE family protein [Patescibacteria group bacterium]|jgi:type II secretory ATPase GspE/PulE/Tfp pilus assembly ATPase PilB-like protein
MSNPLPKPKTPSIEDLLKKPTTTASSEVSSPGVFKGAKKLAGASAKKIKSVSDMSQIELLEHKMKQIQTSDIERQVQGEAPQHSLPYINLKGFPISPEALTLLSREEAESKKVIVFLKVTDEIRLATSQPSEEAFAVAKKLAEDHASDVQVYYCSEASLQFGLALYEALPKTVEVVYGVKISSEDLQRFEKELSNFKDLQEKLQKASITDVVTLIIGAALKGNASDVHIEAEEEDIKVRLRIDGILNDTASIPKDQWKLIISRIKLLSGMKINIDTVPQDGRITIYLTNEKIEIRVSALPTAYGESVVMRLLRPKSISLDFEKLGLEGIAWERLKQEIARPNGMIVTTGPTGSGKTTTLYAILKKLNTSEVKIITLEDPVEYKLQGINQSQIDHSKDYTFAKGLRSILRQDPDIVMVGEIRDTETAEIAVQAALTGHLVISTIHTNNAAGAIPRFLSMGVKPFFLAPALNCVIGQRLVRVLCPDCKAPIKLDEAVFEQVKKELSDLPPVANIKIDIDKLEFYGPSEKTKTCKTCNGLGYKGRLGIYELFTMNKDIEHMILGESVSEYDMLAIAKKFGMVTMTQDGLLKASRGLTSVEEVLRVAGMATSYDEEAEEIADKQVAEAEKSTPTS